MNNNEIPKILENELCVFLKHMWCSNWFKDFSDEHFLIKVITNKLDDFQGKQQLLHQNFIDDIVIDENIASTFCMNFSSRMERLSIIFGEKKIKKFVDAQLSAGKSNYKEEKFFQALSEISILSFFSYLHEWTEYNYEPPASTENKHNPEASFVYKNQSSETIKFNVEVKTPDFKDKIEPDTIIPSVLLTNDGRKFAKDFIESKGFKYLDPKATKLLEFINNSCLKFNIPNKNECNILYISWTFRNFEDNSYLEAWSLLTNEYNGLLTHPEKWDGIISTTRKINQIPDFKNRISAIVVYTEPFEGILYTDFAYIWRNHSYGPCFRMFVIDESKKDMIEKITRMKNDHYDNQYYMAEISENGPINEINIDDFKTKLHSIIKNNIY